MLEITKLATSKINIDKWPVQILDKLIINLAPNWSVSSRWKWYWKDKGSAVLTLKKGKWKQKYELELIYNWENIIPYIDRTSPPRKCVEAFSVNRFDMDYDCYNLRYLTNHLFAELDNRLEQWNNVKWVLEEIFLKNKNQWLAIQAIFGFSNKDTNKEYLVLKDPFWDDKDNKTYYLINLDDKRIELLYKDFDIKTDTVINWMYDHMTMQLDMYFIRKNTLWTYEIRIPWIPRNKIYLHTTWLDIDLTNSIMLDVVTSIIKDKWVFKVNNTIQITPIDILLFINWGHYSNISTELVSQLEDKVLMQLNSKVVPEIFAIELDTILSNINNVSDKYILSQFDYRNFLGIGMLYKEDKQVAFFLVNDMNKSFIKAWAWWLLFWKKWETKFLLENIQIWWKVENPDEQMVWLINLSRDLSVFLYKTEPKEKKYFWKTVDEINNEAYNDLMWDINKYWKLFSISGASVEDQDSINEQLFIGSWDNNWDLYFLPVHTVELVDNLTSKDSEVEKIPVLAFRKELVDKEIADIIAKLADKINIKFEQHDSIENEVYLYSYYWENNNKINIKLYKIREGETMYRVDIIKENILVNINFDKSWNIINYEIINKDNWKKSEFKDFNDTLDTLELVNKFHFTKNLF